MYKSKLKEFRFKLDSDKNFIFHTLLAALFTPNALYTKRHNI